MRVKLKFIKQLSKCTAYSWILDLGSWIENSARSPRGAKLVLFFGTVCAFFLFIALTAVLPEAPPSAAAVVLDAPVRDQMIVDPDLVLNPGPGKMGNGPLAKRALALADNPRVKVQLEHLLIDKRDNILASLALSTRYLPHIVPILEKYDLPPELVYLCIIESGYRQSARSHAGAVGMWQMIQSTSSRFDLRTDPWVDERLDFVKSTEGAASFIKYLLKRFDSWDHVLAAYNAGEGRVGRAVRRAKNKGLDPEMENLRLPRETRIYVPAFYAALLIAMEPERYGLFPDYQPPLDYVEIQVAGGVALTTIAEHLGCSAKELKSLNPSILRGRVPVSSQGYPLRVPCSVGEGRAKAVAASLNEVRYVSYRVRKGDTLWDISRKFGVSISRITRAGHHRGNSSRIFPGETLLVALTAGEAG
jgi:membrane-bound lytic murein transglycosylase D